MGISGTTITLTGTSDVGAVNLTTSTDATGFYRFNNLRPGTYSISESQPNGWNDGRETIGTPGGVTGSDQFTNIGLPANFDGVNNNFGEIRLGQISGLVFSDISAGGFNNGVQDNGEQGIAGVTIQLDGIDYLGRPITQAATTGADGRYLFSSLLPGAYTIIEIQPTGYIDGKDTLGSLGGQLANDRFVSVNLPPAGSGANYNFAELIASSISGYVYGDLGQGGFNDGIKQQSEQGIGGVSVRLEGADDLGAVSRIATTDSNGFYRFANLRPGAYSINETQPAGWIDGKDTIGTPGGTALNDQLVSINLPAGFDGLNNNFGEIRLGQLSGTVYHDRINNGVIDLGDAGIGGVTLQLSGVDTFGSPIAQLTTTTDALGRYSFLNLVPGNYSIVEIQPDYLDGKDTVGALGGVAGNDVLSAISLAAGASGPNYNFGELIPSTISGYVYVDVATGSFNDGFKHPSEQGIAGVLITLTGNNDQGAVNLQQLTDANGFYSFTGLRPGTYSVTETHPDGYVDGKDSIGVYGGQTGNDVFTAIVMPSAAHNYNNNFGELRPVISVAHDPEIPDDIGPETPVFVTPALTIVSKGQLLASTVHLTDTALAADARYVNSLYTAILGRNVEQSGLVTWLNYLRAGGSRAALAQEIWNSAEHRARQVIALYDTFLGTTPDSGALQFYVQRLRSGVSELSVAATIAGGPHVAAIHPTIEGYVTRLFEVALGRSPDLNELTAWSAFNGSRVNLALSIFTSDEALGQVVQHTFLQILNRPADAQEVAFRIAQLKAGGRSYGNVVVDILTSAEYIARVGA